MSMTIRDAEDATMQAQSGFKMWVDEFTRTWRMPVANTALAGVLKRVDPATRAELAKRVPQSGKVFKDYGGG